jgi:hypothetical protein
MTASRAKGQVGEREVAALLRELTGLDVRRRVRQHRGDSDLVGVPGWSIECKRHAKATPATIAAWWAQAVAQAGPDEVPVLVYRLDHRPWRAVWPLSILLAQQPGEVWRSYELTVDGSLEAWAAVAREIEAQQAGELATEGSA